MNETIRNNLSKKGVLTLTLNRPEVLNAMNADLILGLLENINEAKSNKQVRSIIITGNTSALRGKPDFIYFAPTKAAQRVMAESLARELGPKGVHVAYILIDAAIDTPRTRPIFAADKDDDFFCKPKDIANEIFHVAHQPRSAWSFNVELRPDNEKW